MRTTIVECDRCGQQNPLYVTELKLATGYVFPDAKNGEHFMRNAIDVCGKCAGDLLTKIVPTMEWGRSYELLGEIRKHRATLVEPKK